MLCEMCGKEVEFTSRVRVEGTVLRLCPDCTKFGEILDPPPVPPSTSGVHASFSRARRIRFGQSGASSISPMSV